MVAVKPLAMEAHETLIQQLWRLLIPCADDRSGFDEGLVVAIKPLAKEAYETLINQHTHASPGEHTGGFGLGLGLGLKGRAPGGGGAVVGCGAAEKVAGHAMEQGIWVRVGTHRSGCAQVSLSHYPSSCSACATSGTVKVCASRRHPCTAPLSQRAICFCLAQPISCLPLLQPPPTTAWEPVARWAT